MDTFGASPLSLLWILPVLVSTVVSMEFANRPENITGFEGDTVIMTCVVADKEEDRPVYWQRYDGSSNRLGPISRDRDTSPYAHLFPDLSPRLEIVGDASRGEYHLLVSNLSLQDQGRFVCSFTNEGGYGVYAPITYVSVLTQTRMSVGQAFDPLCQATVSTPRQAVSVGTTVVLVCDAYGRPGIISTLSWYMDTSRGSGAILLKSCKPLPQQICTFRLTFALRDIGVTFTCIAGVGPAEQQQQKFRPQFEPTPSCSLKPLSNTTTVVVQPPSSAVTAGETATFFCSARVQMGLGQLRYKWFLNDDQQLTSATHRLQISSTSGYMHDNDITCVVSDHFGYLGHGSAVLIVEMPREEDPTPVWHIETTNDIITERTESISRGDDSVPINDDRSVDILKPTTIPDSPRATVFPLMLVISLAAGAILMALILVVVTTCIVKHKRRDSANLDNKAIQLGTVRPTTDLKGYSKPRKKKRQAPVAPTVNAKQLSPEPVASLCNKNKPLMTYAVLDPDQVDNDSLNSLDLQKMIDKGEGSPRDELKPTNATAAYCPEPSSDVSGKQKVTSTGGQTKFARGRSTSSSFGPVLGLAHAGKKTQDGTAVVAYAVTNIVEDRPAVDAKTDKNPAPSSFYDNNRLSGYAASAKGLSRKRAMSSPMASVRLTTGEEASSKESHKGTTSDSVAAKLLLGDTCAYAVISEIAEKADDDDAAATARDFPGETDGTEPNGGAVFTVPEPPYPSSYLRSDNAYAISRVVSPAAKKITFSHALKV